MTEEMLAVLVTAMVLGVPILGFTVRMVARPLAEAIATLKDSFTDSRQASMSDRRLLALEEEVDALRKAVERLVEAEEFRRALDNPEREAPARLSPGREALDGIESGGEAADRIDSGREALDRLDSGPP